MNDPPTSNPNNVEPYIWRFICAVYPSAPNLALASFSEEKALTDATDEIERLKRERAEMVCGHQNAEHAMLDNLAEARASIDRLQRELADWKQADTDRCLELFDVRERHGNALIERDRLREMLEQLEMTCLIEHGGKHHEGECPICNALKRCDAMRTAHETDERLCSCGHSGPSHVADGCGYIRCRARDCPCGWRIHQDAAVDPNAVPPTMPPEETSGGT